MAKWLINETSCNAAERFIQAKVQESGYLVDNLRCRMKWSRGKHAVVGYCCYPDKNSTLYTISARVMKHARLPVNLKYGVGTWQKKTDDGGRLWGFVHDEESTGSHDQLMVWIVAHELWHFLCKTKQEKGNYQTKANVFGFKWMREFKEVSR